MKTLIFSDSHLGTKFDEEKFQALKQVIEQADRVILNGDFWDGYLLHDFTDFIESTWKTALFPLLKQRETIYIYGNHDKKKYSDERVNLFSTSQTKQYRFTENGKTFIVEHGDRIAPLIDIFIPYQVSIPFTILHDWAESFIISLMGEKYYKYLHSVVNNRIKKYAKKHLKPDEILITGHTHLAELNVAQQYANSGVNKHHLAQHLWIENGKIKLETGRY
ncbi:hypothetical protein HGB07_04275 [Candidatus Roizmanbacteria bacterium]|nr:hypothetical protein [Candidatus Roizmanbacteria bacterium]